MPEAVNDIHFIEPMILPKGKQYHIYMSYASSDTDFALRLDNLLLEKGFKCCMYDKDFTCGKRMTNNILDNMKQSVQVVVLLSKNYIASSWMQFESFVVLELHIKRNRYKPIILMRDKCYTLSHMKMSTFLQADGPLETWIGLLLEALNDQTDSNYYSANFNLHEIDAFRQLIERGSEQRHYVRIVVVGEQGAGKSCLVHRLLNKDIKDVISTDCLDIQINVCGVDLDTGEWCFINEDHFSGTTRLGQKLKNVKHNTDSTEVFYNRKKASKTNTQSFYKQTRADTSANGKSSAEAISRTENDFYWKESLSQVNAVKPFNRRLAGVSLWDFAGHTEYYPTHQLFLSHTCIVLLVTDITKKIGDLSRKSFNGHFMDVSEQPMENVADNLDDVKSTYQNDLNNVVQRDEKRGHFRRHFFLSNTDERNYSKEIPRIRKYIYDISSQEDNWGVEVPLEWIPLENEIIKHREMGKNILSFQSIKKISDESHWLIVDEDEFKMFLKFHHDLGTVIYFDDVPDFIIINPNWFVKALRCIVSARDFISENLHLNWKEYEESGYIGMGMIQAIFKRKDPELAHNQEHIMHVLDKYDIVIEMPNDVRPRVNEKQYCVPCIVISSAIESITINFVGQEKTSILCFEFEFLPPVFFVTLLLIY